MICATSVDTIRTPVVDVIGQLIRDVIGRLSVEPRCNWLERLNSEGQYVYRRIRWAVLHQSTGNCRYALIEVPGRKHIGDVVGVLLVEDFST